MSRRKRVEDVGPVRGVYDLGMELDPVQASIGALARRTGEPGLDASAVKPGGGSNTVSRWLIQHCWSLGSPTSRRPESRTVSGVRPNSPAGAPSTRPPSDWTIACIP